MSEESAAEAFVSECDMDFYYKFSTEVFDIVNLAFYFVFYLGFQLIGLWGIVFKKAVSLAKILKFSYLGFQHIFSAQGLYMF